METNKELIDQLREYAGNAGYSHQDYADTMRLAAAALSQRSEAVDAPSDEMVIRGAEVLHDSLRHAGCTFDFDHSLNGTEIQQGIAEAVFNAMIEVMQQKPAPAPSAAAGEQPFPLAWSHAQRIAEAEQFLKAYSDTNMEKLLGDYLVQPIIRKLASMIGQWQQAAAYAMSADNCAVQPTPAQGDAVPVNSDALATMLTVFDMGLGFALCHHGFAETRNAIKDLQKDFTEIRIAVANATRQSSADAVDAVACYFKEHQLRILCTALDLFESDTDSLADNATAERMNVYLLAKADELAAIAAQGGKGGA